MFGSSMPLRCLIVLLLGFASLSIHSPAPAVSPMPYPPTLVPQIVGRYPHDSNAFTQGLIWKDGGLIETTGQYGRSEIRHVRLKDGKVLKSVKLPPHIFGEGMTDWGKELLSISWQNGIGYRWDAKSLKRKSSFTYGGEGWGLAQDGKRLFLSDGSDTIRIVDPMTFAQTGSFRACMAAGGCVDQLNELEFIKGKLFANIWQTNRIAVIDPGSAEVIAFLDLTNLAVEVAPKLRNMDSVLNGIAYDAAKDIIYVTGKNWPTVFAVRVAINGS
jgi:glutaminyl-peptide cyclotransferase